MIIANPWLYFNIAFAVMLLATALMNKQGEYLFTKDPLRRKFSMMELEFPAKKDDLAYLIRGIYLLPDEARKTIKALRAQLLIDYLLFIPATYGGIFLLCIRLSEKMITTVGYYYFLALACGQCLCFVLDYIENTWFWIIISKPNLAIPKTNTSFRMLQVLEILKWGFALAGAISGFSVLFYFWLTGLYNEHSLAYMGCFVAEIILFMMLQKAITKKDETKPATTVS